MAELRSTHSSLHDDDDDDGYNAPPAPRGRGRPALWASEEDDSTGLGQQMSSPSHHRRGSDQGFDRFGARRSSLEDSRSDAQDLICKRPGCGKPANNGIPDGFCSRDCQRTHMFGGGSASSSLAHCPSCGRTTIAGAGELCASCKRQSQAAASSPSSAWGGGLSSSPTGGAGIGDLGLPDQGGGGGASSSWPQSPGEARPVHSPAGGFSPGPGSPSSLNLGLHPRPDAVMFDDPRQPGRAGLIGFTSVPGNDRPCDELSQAAFLGNDFEVGARSINVKPPCRNSNLQFSNAEAALQAMNFITKAEDFQRLSALEALQKKDRMRGQESITDSGFISLWKAVSEILKAKFQQNDSMARALLKTDDAFLLEIKGDTSQEVVPEDNNSLGMHLMLLRDELGGSGAWSEFLLVTCQVDVVTGEHDSADGRRQWQEVVGRAAFALQERLVPNRSSWTLGLQSIGSRGSLGGGASSASLERGRTGGRSFLGDDVSDRGRGAFGSQRDHHRGDRSPKNKRNSGGGSDYKGRPPHEIPGAETGSAVGSLGFGGSRYREGSSSRAVSTRSSSQPRRQRQGGPARGHGQAQPVIIHHPQHTSKSALDLLASLTHEEAQALLQANEEGLREFFMKKSCPEIGEALYNEGVTGTSLHMMSITNIERDLGLTLGEQLALKACVKRIKTIAKSKFRGEKILEKEEFQVEYHEHRVAGICNEKFHWMGCGNVQCCHPRKPPTAYHTLPKSAFELNDISVRVITYQWNDGYEEPKRRKKHKAKGLFGWWCGWQADDMPRYLKKVDNISLNTIKDVDFEVNAPYKKDHPLDCMDSLFEHSTHETVIEPARIKMVYEDEGADGGVERKTKFFSVNPDEAEEIVHQIQVFVQEAVVAQSAEEQLGFGDHGR